MYTCFYTKICVELMVIMHTYLYRETENIVLLLGSCGLFHALPFPSEKTKKSLRQILHIVRGKWALL